MPFMPIIEEHATYREVTDTFAGYNHNAKIADGEFYDTQNLTSQYYPLMSNREKRGYVKTLYDPGGIMDKVNLAYVDEGVLWLNDRQTSLSGLLPGEKQMVPFGSYICIFPDGKYYNTADPDDYGDMSLTLDGNLVRDIAELGKYLIADTAPGGEYDRHYLEHPPNTDELCYTYIGLNRADGVSKSEFKAAIEAFNDVGSIRMPSDKLYKFGSYSSEELELEWLRRNDCAIAGVYYDDYYGSQSFEHALDMPAEIKDCDPDTGEGNDTGIYNPIRATHVATYNGDSAKKKYYLPPDARPETGNLPKRITCMAYVDGVQAFDLQVRINTPYIDFENMPGVEIQPTTGTNNIRICWYSEFIGFEAGMLVSVPKKTIGSLNENSEMQSADVPDMDYVIECKNRLWGCKYGIESGSTVNEIYACALGNFKNWKKFEGISTDPYAASVGSDGPWTGAINYLGYPTFFKEDRIHRVAVSAIGAHEITETVCDGVQPGSSKSLVVLNGILFYKTNANVVTYQGGIAPSAISEALGDIHYYEAAAGVVGDNYYISMRNAENEWSLFCFDGKRGIWIKEDSTHVKEFATVSEELYALTAEKEIWALKGTTGTLEDHVDWYGESGVMYYQYPDKKYTNRYNFRLQMDRGTRVTFLIEYDSSGRWEKQGEIITENLRTVTIPVRPRRCDHLRLRIQGRGNCKIFSVARVLTIGSDY